MPAAPTFTIAVLGDFASLHKSRALATEIDIDSQESFLHAFEPRLELGFPFCGTLDLSSAAQLHPDALCARVFGLSALLEARAEASDPRRAAALAVEAGAVLDLASAPIAVETRGVRAPASDRALLDDLLGPSRRSDTDPVRRLAHSLGDAAADRSDHAATERRRAALDLELGARLRQLLGHAELRRLEALCLGLRALARAAPDPDRVRIRAVHAPLAELELAGAAISGASFLIAAQAVRADQAGLAELQALAQLARRAGVGGVLASFDSAGLDAAELRGSDWQSFRAGEIAIPIGLCHPRVLARLPYGADTAPIESFPFEELQGQPTASSFVWCSGALAAGRALARCVTQTGGTRALPDFLELEDLPVYAGSAAAGIPAWGPAEEALSDREAESLVAVGLTPIVALRGSDRARIYGLRALDGRPLLDR